ncbi:hypothetical protein FRB90_005666 [Tulasnella sp. 427]|nr:hypothetical protein FRB90_005666 [Tulasnella sp. 427]
MDCRACRKTSNATNAGPSRDAAHAYGPNPFLAEATPTPATTTLPFNSDWNDNLSPPTPSATELMAKALQCLQQALHWVTAAEAADNNAEWPPDLYKSIRSLCETRSAEKQRCAIELSHIIGSDTLMELAKQNTMLMSAFLSATTSSTPTESPQRHDSTRENYTGPKNSYASKITITPMPRKPNHTPTNPPSAHSIGNGPSLNSALPGPLMAARTRRRSRTDLMRSSPPPGHRHPFASRESTTPKEAI